MRGATSEPPPRLYLHPISIHAPREGSDLVFVFQAADKRQISIHAPREGSDLFARPHPHPLGDISIHAPREGSDLGGAGADATEAEFLSTLPVRGATTETARTQQTGRISIHAPREGSDHQVLMQGGQTPYFYPRSP